MFLIVFCSFNYLLLFLLVSDFCFLLLPVVLTRMMSSVVLLPVLVIVLMEWMTSYLVGIVQIRSCLLHLKICFLTILFLGFPLSCLFRLMLMTMMMLNEDFANLPAFHLLVHPLVHLLVSGNNSC